MVKHSGIRFMSEGPFRAEQFSPRDPYELSHGHALRCLPTGGRGGERTLAGGAALATDPAVTKLIWVVRLTGARRVEVYEKDAAVRVVGDGEELLAPGILQNPVPVAALFDPEAAYRVTLRNLLQREGYESVDAIRDEGRLEGFAQAILSVLEARGIPVDECVRAAILGCAEAARLTQWLARATTAVRADDVIR